MKQFIEKYRDRILGDLSGFDRLVFRAAPRRLNIRHFDASRALRPWGDDKNLLDAVNHGDSPIDGFRNRDLQAMP